MTAPEWISLTLRNASPRVLIITRVELSWGKLYASGDQSRELATQDVEGSKIAPNESYVIGACACEDSSSPAITQGQVTIAVEGGAEVLRRVYWNCPPEDHNDLQLSAEDDGWVVETSPWTVDGALGDVTVVFSSDEQ